MACGKWSKKVECGLSGVEMGRVSSKLLQNQRLSLQLMKKYIPNFTNFLCHVFIVITSIDIVIILISN